MEDNKNIGLTIEEQMREICKRLSDNHISLVETGELSNTQKGAKQQRADDDYGFIPWAAYKKLVDLRRHAVTKYGAFNHVDIPWTQNTSRSIRHILAAVTHKTEKQNSTADELTHACMRLMMAVDAMFTDKPRTKLEPSTDPLVNMECYNDFDSTFALYMDKTPLPNLQLFPSVLRRVAALIANDKESVGVLCSQINSMQQVTYALDIIVEILMESISLKPTLVINNLLVCIAVLLYCINLMSVNIVHYNIPWGSTDTISVDSSCCITTTAATNVLGQHL